MRQRGLLRMLAVARLALLGDVGERERNTEAVARQRRSHHRQRALFAAGRQPRDLEAIDLAPQACRDGLAHTLGE